MRHRIIVASSLAYGYASSFCQYFFRTFFSFCHRIEVYSSASISISKTFDKIKNIGADKIYKKIDSTLRGNIKIEIEEFLKILEEKEKIAVILPFPKLNRVVKNGKLYINNMELIDTEYSKDVYWKLSSSNVLDYFGGELITLEEIRTKNLDRIIKEKINKGEIVFKKDFSGIIRKIYLCEQIGRTPENLWDGNKFGTTRQATSVIKELFNNIQIFDTPKPHELIINMLQISSTQNDIILDFFSGSATTAHAVMDLNAQDGGNRKFIMVQLPEPTDESSEAFKAGYKNICEIGKERIRRAGKKIKEQLTVDSGQLKLGEEAQEERKLDTGFRVFRLDKSNFNIWQGENVENLQQALFSHVEHIDKNSSTEDILFELILKAGYEINTPVIELVLEGKKVYSLMDGGVLISLEKNLTKEFIKAIAEMEPIKVILLDEGFNNNDALKTNAVEIMKSKNIDSLESLMQQAKDNGVEFIACSMSMDVMGIKKEELLDDITIGGVAAYLDRAENANVNLFI